MPNYLVIPSSSLKDSLYWEFTRASVFEADSVDSACRAAAKDMRIIGTFLAIECEIWGAEIQDASGARKIGAPPEPAGGLLEEAFARMAELQRQLASPEDDPAAA